MHEMPQWGNRSPAAGGRRNLSRPCRAFRARSGGAGAPRFGARALPRRRCWCRSPAGWRPSRPAPATSARCWRGYMEVLFKTADTPLGRELEAALARYSGVHLAAFAVADAAGHRRLATPASASARDLCNARSAPRPAPAPRRFTSRGSSRARWPKGRIQMLTHHTEDAVWQTRWLASEWRRSALRPGRSRSRPIRRSGGALCALHRPARGRLVARQEPRLDRGRVDFVTPEPSRRLLPEVADPAPSPSWAPTASSCGRSLTRAPSAPGRPRSAPDRRRAGGAVSPGAGRRGLAVRRARGGFSVA